MRHLKLQFKNVSFIKSVGGETLFHSVLRVNQKYIKYFEKKNVSKVHQKCIKISEVYQF